jgi:hypothetical protein
MEIGIANNVAAKKTYVFFLASPHDKNNPVWKELYKILDKGIERVNK